MANKLSKFIGGAANGLKKSLAFGDYIDIISPSIYRGGSFNGNFFFGGNGIDYRFAYENHRSALEAYMNCPPLAAVMNRKAQCYINGKTEILNTQKKEANSLEAKRIKALMRKPNPIQTWKQFEAQQYIYIQLFGFCITLPIMPAGFEDMGPMYATSLWNIPPYMVDITETNKLFFQTDITGLIESIRLNYKGLTSNLPLKNLFIFKDFTPGSYSMLFPDSRIRAIAMPINNTIASYMTRHELINYAGAQGLFSSDATDTSGSIPLKEDEKNQLQEDMKRQYGIQRGQWRHIIAPTKMNWTAIGKPTKDLMLFEEVTDDIMRICDALNYPSPLLNSEKGPNVSNTAQYQAQIYTDGVIPESEDYYEQWNEYFKTDDCNIIIRKNYSHVPALQENKKEQGQASYYLNQSLMLLWNQDLITANEILEQNEIDTVSGWDIYRSDFIKLGKIQPNFKPTDPAALDTGEEDPKSEDDGKDK